MSSIEAVLSTNKKPVDKPGRIGRTLAGMDQAVANFKKGEVSEPVDLSDFEEKNRGHLIADKIYYNTENSVGNIRDVIM